MEFAPIVLFAYKRVEILRSTISKLQENIFADQSDLYIFSDGFKNPADEEIVKEIRAYLKGVTGFKSVTVMESPVNRGLATSVINGVTDVLKKYDSVIVLEDDIVTSADFLNFMNSALRFYKNNTSVLSISGYSADLDIADTYPYDVYFTQRASSWGWATWKNRWDGIDWNVSDYNNFINNTGQKKQFNRMGTDLVSMLKKKMEGKIDSWAIRWCYHQYKNNMYTAYPVTSKVQNIGFDKNATHTYGYKHLEALQELNFKPEFNFPQEVQFEKKIIKKFIALYSFTSRIKNKLNYYIQTKFK